MLHTKNGIEQKAKVKNPQLFNLHAVIFWKISPWKEFSKNYVFNELKICLSVDRKADRIEKATF